MLTVALVLAAVAAGVTGSWSPCGFSMVDTLAPHGYAGRMRVTIAACATFALGALVGGVVTFGGLSLLGSALGAGGTTAAAVAGAVALAAAIGELRGARIVPQVRRQVPESWRRVLPVPLAAGLYGVLLGLGFTTFILTFAVWALAGTSIALGDPSLGLLVGLGFGLGRLVPVVVLAPAAGTEWGTDAHAAMAERPAILRGMRAVDAVALAVCALALATAPAQAATRQIAANATDPSLDGATLAWHDASGAGVLRVGATLTPAPGPKPAVGDGRVAWIADGAVHVRGGDLPADLVIPDPRARNVAVSAGWVAWRTTAGGLESIVTARLPTGEPGQSGVAAAGRMLGRPALSGSTLVFHVTTAGGAVIRAIDLATGRRSTLRSQHRSMLLNPSALGTSLVYVRSTYRRQQLLLGKFAKGRVSGDRVLYSTTPTARRDDTHEPGYNTHEHYPGGLYPRPPAGRSDTLWTTALGPGAAYVTRLRQRTGKPTRAVILRVTR
jgi:hypothetical protein